MNNILPMFTVLFYSVVMTNCSPSPDTKVKNMENEIESNIKKEKAETIQNLQTLRDDINSRLDIISNKMEDANSASQSELESIKKILMEHRTKVLTALDNIDHSTVDSWDNIEQAAKTTSSEVRLEFEKVTERLDNALESTEK